ncbi:MAG: class IV adenylate cyclase [Pseudomonadota bacterium]
MLTDPGDHFSGRYEVERKLKVDDLSAMRERLDALGAVPFVLGNTETDIFLDLEDGRIAQAGKSHVLRKMRPSGRVLWIVKGPGPDECIAMDLPDGTKAVAMLSALGFRERSRLTKARDIFFVGDCHVTLDHVESLGAFVEVAAMTDDRDALGDLAARVADVIAQLGLGGHAPVEHSYLEMLTGSQKSGSDS